MTLKTKPRFWVAFDRWVQATLAARVTPLASPSRHDRPVEAHECEQCVSWAL